jgi:hypothetical protein
MIAAVLADGAAVPRTRDRPPMVGVKLPKAYLGVFHLLRSNEVAQFLGVQGERVSHFEWRFLLVLSCPFVRVGTRQPPIRHVWCDSA